MDTSSLNQAAIKFRKELLLLPIIGLEHSLRHMTLRPGIQFEELVNSLEGSFELRPHTGDLNLQDGISAGERKLRVYVGDCIAHEKLEDLRSKLLGGEMLLTGTNKTPNKHPLEQRILALVMNQISKKLNSNIFSAVRNDTGTTTAELFNGFDTITQAEITDLKITEALGNYVDLEPITDSNAVDILMGFYDSISDELKTVPTKLFVPPSVLLAYNKDYLGTFGSVAYNKEFQKTFLEGTSNLCEIVPLIGKKESDFIHLTTKPNMLIGVDQLSDMEYIKVREVDNPFVTQFVAKMCFGVQFESIAPQNFCVGDISTSGTLPAPPAGT